MARRVLHVLPHAGAGAQTYIDVLTGLGGYDFENFALSDSRSPAAALASIAKRQPTLWRAAERADLIHAHGEAASLASLPLLAAKPSVVVVHGLHLLRRMPAGLPRALARVGLHAVVAAANRTLCPSQAEFDDLNFLPRRLRAKAAVIPNGVSLPPPPQTEARARKRAELGLDADSIAVLYLGQLELRKDPQTAVRAAIRAHHEDARISLLLAGDGPCASELAGFSGAQVRLIGQRGDVGDLLDAVDVFVMPSHREGMSFAILEALSHGVATIVSDGLGNHEAVGDAGLVFAVGDDAHLATLILELARDPARRAALGSAGRKRVSTELSADRMRDATKAVYDAILRVPDLAAADASA